MNDFDVFSFFFGRIDWEEGYYCLGLDGRNGIDGRVNGWVGQLGNAI